MQRAHAQRYLIVSNTDKALTTAASTITLFMLARRYFGAAKQLPGVKELFEKEAPRQLRRTRHQMYAHINADYYGFRDEEDGVLEKVEAEAERAVRQKVDNPAIYFFLQFPRCSLNLAGIFMCANSLACGLPG